MSAEKKLKAVIKEGGKRGIEIDGAATMGGLKFFCTKVDEPEGDIDLLEHSVEAMNVPCNENSEELTGGSGEIGKMVFSAGETKLAICAYVPDALKDLCDGLEWLKDTIAPYGGKIVRGNAQLCFAEILADPEADKFPLKIRDKALPEAIQYLRNKDLFPPAESDDSDSDFAMGDDFFDTI